MKMLCGIVFFLLVPLMAAANIIIGGEGIYTVEKGDTIELIASKLGVEKKALIETNQLDPKLKLKQGEQLKVNTRKIVPKTISDGIIINIPDRMLYYFKGGVLDSAFPVCLGMPSVPPELGKIEWKTPEGKFKVTGKEKDPVWRVPESVKKEMELKNKPVEEIVPPGKGNPLGRYAIRTSISSFLIHETIWPTSIYRYRSHGCVRIMPKEMEKFYPKVEKNTEGEIIYTPIKIALTKDERVFLEVHRDIYKKLKNFDEGAKKEIEKSGLSKRIDWQKAETVLKEKKGVAEDVTGERQVSSVLDNSRFLKRIVQQFKSLFSQYKKN